MQVCKTQKMAAPGSVNKLHHRNNFPLALQVARCAERYKQA